jgi:LCP family protein required for cell wall assembly
VSIVTPPRDRPRPAARAAAPSAPPQAPEPPRGGWAKRLALGCLIIVLASAATSATFFSGQLSTLRAALSQNPSLNLKSGLLVNAGFGGAQTILLVGNDQRAHTTTTPVLPHSNEMLLVRIDPSKPWISMMSIPRELEVTIHPANSGAVTTRFNYAYTAGGIPLLVSTIKQVLRLSVNHVVVIDFNQFKRAVDEIGCVYSTVDERYYHVNTPTSQQYQEINLQPGYQEMCGAQALQFVSYRHGDTSLVRDARDQSFLLDVKNQYGPTLVDNIGKFERIFGRTVQTDAGLHTTTGILDLLGTLISSSARTVRRTQFQVNLQPPGANPCNCATATAGQISASVHSFLYGRGAPPKQSTAAAAHAVHRRKTAAHLPLAPTPPAELAQARSAATSLPFPLEYPRVRDLRGSAAPVDVRGYLIHGPGGQGYPAYVEVFWNGLLGEYYDVQGMTWTTAPLFDNPTQSVHVAGRTYYLYYNGQHLKMVAWYQHGAVYWVRNTLVDTVGNGELLAIAEQTVPVTAAGAGQVSLHAVSAPVRVSASSPTPLVERIGSIGGLLTVAAVPLVGFALFKRRRELAGLRAQLYANLQQEGRLTAAAAHRVAALPGAQPPMRSYTPRRAAARPRRPLSRPALAGSGLATIAIAGALAVLVAGALGGGATSGGGAGGSSSAFPSVAVLNATSRPGAANRVARQLRVDGVHVAAVANIAPSRPAGLWILYARGERSQAVRLARLLATRAPKLAPIDSGAKAAAGSAARVVAVVA